MVWGLTGRELGYSFGVGSGLSSDQGLFAVGEGKSLDTSGFGATN